MPDPEEAASLFLSLALSEPNPPFLLAVAHGAISEHAFNVSAMFDRLDAPGSGASAADRQVLAQTRAQYEALDTQLRKLASADPVTTEDLLVVGLLACLTGDTAKLMVAWDRSGLTIPQFLLKIDGFTEMPVWLRAKLDGCLEYVRAMGMTSGGWEALRQNA